MPKRQAGLPVSPVTAATETKVGIGTPQQGIGTPGSGVRIGASPSGNNMGIGAPAVLQQRIGTSEQQRIGASEQQRIGASELRIGTSDEHASEEMVQEAEELKHGSLPAPVLPSKAEVEAHNVSHLPFRSWCSACVRGRGLSMGHRKVDAETKQDEQIPTISVDYGFFGQPEDKAHCTLPVLIVRDRKSKGIWSHPVPAKGVTHPYPAKALMADLDFMGYKRVILKSDQEPSILALCEAVKHGWHGEIVPEASPKGESKSNGEAERAVQSVHGLARTLKDFLEQQSGITLESRSPLLACLAC